MFHVVVVVVVASSVCAGWWGEGPSPHHTGNNLLVKRDSAEVYLIDHTNRF